MSASAGSMGGGGIMGSAGSGMHHLSGGGGGGMGMGYHPGMGGGGYHSGMYHPGYGGGGLGMMFGPNSGMLLWAVAIGMAIGATVLLVMGVGPLASKTSTDKAKKKGTMFAIIGTSLGFASMCLMYVLHSRHPSSAGGRY